MSGVTLRLNVQAGDAMARHLAALAALEAGHFAAARRQIGEYLVEDVQDNLEGQRLFDGRPMPQSKAAIKRKGRTLIDKHHLYDSYVYQLGGNTVEAGSALVYAAIHHHGGLTGRLRHRFRMEARPVLGIGERQERRLGDLLIAEIRAAGGQ